MRPPPSRSFQQKLGKLPLFPFLLVFFFVLHGVLENYHPDIFIDALELLGLYLVAATLFFFLFYWIFRNFLKAAVMSFFLLAFNFFFGSAQDFFKDKFHDPFFMKYSVLIPIVLLLFGLLFYFLLRTRKNLLTFSFYLNAVFILFIAIDLFSIFYKASKPHKELDLTKDFRYHDSIQKPDIYLIIADEYAGKQTLEEYFNFDNSRFENELRSRGFHVVDTPSSNYNATIYSMSSMLNMDYIRTLKSRDINYYDMLYCKAFIRNNNATHFFEKLGYEFYNHSFFEFTDKPPVVFNSFIKQNKKLINSQTFLNRAHQQIGYHFFSDELVRFNYFINYRNNIKCEALLRDLIPRKSNRPRFIYTHLALPHHPYYVDSNGVEREYSEIVNESRHKSAFVNYTVYANRKYLDIIDKIISSSEKPPVIILMSDHGWRQFLQPEGNEKHFFKTLNAVYLPSKNYNLFYKGISNVNQFRSILNAQFGQNLPMLKDSTVLLNE